VAAKRRPGPNHILSEYDLGRARPNKYAGRIPRNHFEESGARPLTDSLRGAETSSFSATQSIRASSTSSAWSASRVIAIKIRDKRLFRNGIPLDEPYAIHIFPGTEAYRDNFPGEPNGPVYPQAKDMLLRNLVDGEIVVPDGGYFTLRDNRDNSLDSRYWGFVGDREVVGKPLLVLYSEDSPTEDLLKNDAFRFAWGRVRWDRFFKIL
jgi:signal peptidase I